jgi:hypothetical protein
VTKKGRLKGINIASFQRDISSENDVEGLTGKINLIVDQRMVGHREELPR